MIRWIAFRTIRRTVGRLDLRPAGRLLGQVGEIGELFHQRDERIQARFDPQRHHFQQDSAPAPARPHVASAAPLLRPPFPNPPAKLPLIAGIHEDPHAPPLLLPHSPGASNHLRVLRGGVHLSAAPNPVHDHRVHVQIHSRGERRGRGQHAQTPPPEQCFHHHALRVGESRVMHARPAEQQAAQQRIERRDVSLLIRAETPLHLCEARRVQRRQRGGHALRAALALRFGRAEHQHRIAARRALAYQLEQSGRAVAAAQSSLHGAVQRRHAAAADDGFLEAGGSRGEEEELRVEPASDGVRRGERRGERDDLEAGIQGAKLQENQLDEMAALRFQRVRLVDHHEIDARLLQREGRTAERTWPSRRQRLRIPLAFSMVLMAIYLAPTPRAYVDMRVQTLRAVRVEALHEQPVGLAEVLEVFLLLFDQRNVRQKQQTLPFPEQNAAQHADFVHQRLPDACGSAVH